MTTTKKLSRYPGARPFEQKQSSLFFGRENDINALYRLIKLRSVVTLYGKSGTGKSSLLNAGIIPKTLEDGRFVPLVVRFNSFNKDGDTNMMPFETTQLAIRGGKKSAKTFLDRLIKDEDSLWHDVKEHYVRHKGERGLLLIFDQFEELFTYDDRAINFFQEELAEALYTDVPQRYWDALKREQDKGNDPLSNEELELMQQPPQVKILISIRADKLHLLSRLDDYLPNILKNNYELAALDTDSATDAIIAPAALPNKEKVYDTQSFAFEPKALKNILDFLTKDGTEKIESTQLQIICNAIQKKVLSDNLSLVKANDIGDLKAIIGNFYADNIAALPFDEQQPARLLIEDHLIFEEEERRLPLYEGKVLKLVSTKTLASLVDNHLLRAEPSMQGGYTYELSHDTLVTPVLQARAKRVKAEREAEEARLSALHDAELAESKRLHDVERGKRRLSNIIATLAVLGLLGAIVLGWQVREKNKALDTTNKNLNLSIINEKEAARQIREHQDSLIIARKKELDNLNQISQKTQEAQEATRIAVMEKLNASKYLSEVQSKSLEAAHEREQAEANFKQAETNFKLAEARKIDIESKENDLRAALEKARKHLQAQKDAEERADKNAADYKVVANALINAQLEFNKAEFEYKNALTNLEKETVDLKNATTILKAAREKERKVKKVLEEKQAELNRVNAALTLAQSNERSILIKYQEQYQQLQSANTQLSEVEKIQNQTITRLVDKERELLLAYQAKIHVQDELQQARLDLDKKASEFEELNTKLATSQVITPIIHKNDLQQLESDLNQAKYDMKQNQYKIAILEAKNNHLQMELNEATEKNKQYTKVIENQTLDQMKFGETKNNVNKEELTKTGKPLTITPEKKSQISKKVEPVMIFVSGGNFQMGNNNGTIYEKPIHNVTVNSFKIAKSEVTQKEWRDIMGSDPPELDSVFKNCNQCPVAGVSWDDIQEFIKKLNQITGKKYRLPTEAEWEFAARGRITNYIYSGSNKIDEVAWYKINSNNKIYPADTKKSNSLGIFNMSGNVWEWCSDYYSADYYSKSPEKNPKGAKTSKYRVLRGGSRLTDHTNCQVGHRNFDSPTRRNGDYGFRLARD